MTIKGMVPRMSLQRAATSGLVEPRRGGGELEEDVGGGGKAGLGKLVMLLVGQEVEVQVGVRGCRMI